MSYFQAIILAVIEGLTEFLPISSTGHLIITQHLLGINSTEFTKSFNIVIQLASILAVIVLFRKTIIKSKHLWKQLIIAFLPTGVLGIIFYKLIKAYLLDSTSVTIVSLIVGGVALLIIDTLPKLKNGQKKIQNLQITNLFTIGLFQTVSMVPGISRSAASIVGGLFSGLARQQAVAFSFLLAIPTMIAATGYDLINSGFLYTQNEYHLLLIGSFFSFLSAMLAVKAFTVFVQKNNFRLFAIYRIIFAIIIWLIIK